MRFAFDLTASYEQRLTNYAITSCLDESSQITHAVILLVIAAGGELYAMAMIDSEALLQEVSGDNPCGSDPELEPAFGALETAAKGKEERASGDVVIPAEDPRWREVADDAIALLTQSKHLAPAVHLTRCATHLEGITGAADGLELIAAMLERYWDTVYPLLDAEDDDDPMFRLNALLPLNARTMMVRDLSLAPIVRVKGLGEFSMRSIRLANGEIEPRGEEAKPDLTHVEAAFTGADLDELQAELDAVGRAEAAFAAISATLDDKLGDGNTIAFPEALGELGAIRHRLTEVLSGRGAAVETVDGETEGDTAGQAVVAAGPIRSREDAIRSLDLVAEYFRKNEPSSPVPLVVDRAKRLIAKDFMEILNDLAPGGVKEAKLISGLDDD